MRIPYSFSTLVLSLFLLISSCDSSSSDPELEAPFIPLKVGNEWVMQFDSVLDGREGEPKMDTVRVVRDTLINNEVWYVIKNTQRGIDFFFSNSDTNYITLREDGLWIQSLNGESKLRVKYPLAEGEHFELGNGIELSVDERFVQYDIPQYGSVEAIAYKRLYTSVYDPSPGSTDAWYSGFAMEETETLSYFSKEVGFVFIEGLWVAPASEDSTWHVKGRMSWELREFIEAP